MLRQKGLIGQAVFVMLAILIGCAKAPEKKAEQKPLPLNVLLITVDTLRADHLSCYGYNRNTSPHIDALAKSGALFESLIAPRGLTWPSLTSLLTSLHPRTHGVRENGDMLDESKLTLPQILKSQGYATAAFLTNMTTAPNRGFDSKIMTHGEDDRATRGAIHWLRHNPNRKFFVWVHYLAPHIPYAPPPPYDQKFQTTNKTFRIYYNQIALNKEKLNDEKLQYAIALYDGEIAYDDSLIGQLLDQLRKLDHLKDTIVIFTADHGEELYQRNFYFSHGCSIYDSVLHVPMIVRFPGMVPEGKRIQNVVENVDISPTILQMLSLPVPKTFEGHGLLPLIQAKSNSPDTKIAYSEIRDKVTSLRTNEWHYIYNPTGFFPDCDPFRFATDERKNGYVIQKEELYDVVSDPLERNNVISAQPRIADSMRSRTQVWVSQDKKTYRQTEPDQKTQEELRALGYIQ